MQCGSRKQAHLFRRQVQHSGPEQGRIEEHGERPEDNDGGDGHGRLVRLAFHDGFRPQHGGGSANGTADGGQQGRIPVHLQQAAQSRAQQNGEGHDDRVNEQGGASDVDHALERQLESVQDDARSQNLLGAELNAGDPRFRQMVAQAVGVNHPQHDADDQRAEGKVLHPLEIRNVTGGKGEENDQQNAVQGIGESFGRHDF